MVSWFHSGHVPPPYSFQMQYRYHTKKVTIERPCSGDPSYPFSWYVICIASDSVYWAEHLNYRTMIPINLDTKE